MHSLNLSKFVDIVKFAAKTALDNVKLATLEWLELQFYLAPSDHDWGQIRKFLSKFFSEF